MTQPSAQKSELGDRHQRESSQQRDHTHLLKATLSVRSSGLTYSAVPTNECALDSSAIRTVS